MKTNIILKIENQEQLDKVQEIVFANGGKWFQDGSKRQRIESLFNGKYIEIDEEKDINRIFKSNSLIESTTLCADLFIRTNGTCEEQEPKYKVGDIITLKSTNKKYKIVYQEKVADEFLYKLEREKDKKMEWIYEREIDNLKKDIELTKGAPKQKTIKELENAKYKVGDFLKGKSGEYKGVCIKIEDTHKCLAGTGFFYTVKNASNEEHYSLSEKYLDKHFELKTDKTNATNPNHYNQMKIQPNEYITANYDCFSWNTANVIKYVSRYKSKNGIEDLEKAIKYLQFEIEELKKTEQ